MPKSPTRDESRGDGADNRRVTPLLETTLLARVVPHLPVETLHRLIRRHGLDASEELVTSATPAQLTALLDLDLWGHAQSGGDPTFDADRFGEWLEVLVEVGPAVAAQTFAALHKDLVIAGLSRHVRVFDLGAFTSSGESDDELPDVHAQLRGVSCELGGYLIRARRSDAWDAIVSVLIALEAEHDSCFHAVMQGCRRLSNSTPERDGLDDLLLPPEQHFHDLAAERDHRRSRQGYASPADARAFLQMARRYQQRGPAVTTSTEINPIAAAYFREADVPADEANDEPLTARRSLHGHSGAESQPTNPEATREMSDSPTIVAELLREAGLMPDPPRALLDQPEGASRLAKLARLRSLLGQVREADGDVYFIRSRELAFLANSLLAGASIQSRSFTAQEACDAAASICNLGLEYWPLAGGSRHGSVPLPESFLFDHTLIEVFEVGWSVLYEDVSLVVARQLVAVLDELRFNDRHLELGCVAFRRTLIKHLEAGTPWLARDAAEVLGTLDLTAWISVNGLLDECPVLPAALNANLDAQTTAVSPTAFEFISTAAQIERVRAFMRKLPRVLS